MTQHWTEREFKVVEDGEIRIVFLGSAEGRDAAIEEAKVLQKHSITLMAKADVGGPPGMRMGAVLGYKLYLKESDLKKWRSLKRPQSAYTGGL